MSKYYSRIIVLVLYLAIHSLYCLAQNNQDADRDELIRLYNAIDGIPWNIEQEISSWEGISLNPDGRVKRIALNNQNLTMKSGQQLPNLNLPFLEVLRLDNNALNGNIPNFNQLPLLDSLYLNNNQFDGIIENYQLPSLRFLNLSSNNLNGAIPNFSSMSKLEVLGLNRVPLNTTLPDFTSTPNLREIYLFQSNIVGIIPDFSNIPNLEILQLGDNQLTGELPDFSNLPNLSRLDIWVNSLSGPFPSLANCPQLTRIDCSKNQFFSLPDFNYLSNLTELIIDENFLTFQDIIPNLGVQTFKYAGQKSAGTTRTFQVDEGTDLTYELGFDLDVSGSSYQWFKNEGSQPYAVTNSPLLEFDNLSLADTGTYQCEITNAQAPDLTLQTQPFTLVVSPAEPGEPCSVPQFEHTLSGRIATFYNQSFGQGSYTWQFGDGAQSSEVNPQHTYSIKGVYQVCLTVTDDCGSRQFCREIQVFDCDSLVPVFDWAVKIPDGSNAMKMNEKDEIFITGEGFFAKYNAEGNLLFNRNIPGAGVSDIALDADGNILLIGSVAESADLDPSEGQFLVSGDIDFFVAKYTSSGNFAWGFLIGDENDASGGESGSGIDTDLEGNVYITGSFDGTIDIDPGSTTQNITSLGNRDIFLAKYNQNGELLFGYGFGGELPDYGSDIVIKKNFIFMIGDFSSAEVDFDPGINSAVFNGGTRPGFPYSAKYTTDGNFIDLYYTAGNVAPGFMFTGFISELNVDPKLMQYTGGSNTDVSGRAYMSFSKLDDQGNRWFYNTINSSNPVGQPRSVTEGVGYDMKGMMYATGWMGNFAQFGDIKVRNNGLFHFFLTKLDHGGDYLYAVSPEMETQTGSSTGLDIEVNSLGDIFTVGEFTAESFDFDPTDNEAIFEDNGSYLIKYAQTCAETACTLSADLEDPTDATCGDANGAASVNIDGAQGTVSILWSNGQTGSSIENIPSGEYSVTISDEAGCEVTRSFTIMDTDVPETNITNVADANCGENNGSATAEVSGGLPPYQISWSNGQNAVGVSTLEASSLSAGTYIATATDNNGCQDRDTVDISGTDAPTLKVEFQNARCDLNNGAATVSVEGGTAPFNIRWDNGQSGETLENLGPGTYTVTVTDSNECKAQSSITLTSTSSPDVETFTQDANCDQEDGVAYVNISGGTPDYNILWNNGQNGDTLRNVGEGQYTVSVTDANNCRTIDTLSILNLPGPELITASENATCGENNGVAWVEITGGTAPFDILWNNSENADTIRNLAPDTYSLTVLDAKGCTSKSTVTVSLTDGPSIDLEVQAASCDASNGAATAIVSQGAPPYQVVWSTGNSSTQSSDFTETLNELPEGQYNVVITDQNQCEITRNFNIESTGIPEITLISFTDANCNLNDGSASISVSGGAGNYLIQWDNGQVSQTANGLAPGLHSVTVTDESNCSSELEVNIGEIETLPAASFSAITSGLEVTFNNSSKDADSYQWDFGDGAGSNLANPQHSFADTGVYEVCLIADNACASDTTCTILELLAESTCNLALTTSSTPSACREASGSATVNVIPQSDSYDYWWQTSPAQFTQTATGLAAGKYQVVVSDGTCRNTATVTVDNEGARPEADFDFTIDSTSVTFVNRSRFGNTFNWNFGNGYLAFTENPSYTYPEAGIYSVTLEVSNNCGRDTIEKTVNLIVTSQHESIPRGKIAILPNPNQGIFEVKLEHFPKGPSKWYIYNLMGQLISEQDVYLSTDQYSQKLNLTDLPNGIYLLKISTSSIKEYLKFEITH